MSANSKKPHANKSFFGLTEDELGTLVQLAGASTLASALTAAIALKTMQAFGPEVEFLGFVGNVLTLSGVAGGLLCYYLKGDSWFKPSRYWALIAGVLATIAHLMTAQPHLAATPFFVLVLVFSFIPKKSIAPKRPEKGQEP